MPNGASVNHIVRRYRESFEGLPLSAWLLALVMLVNRSGAMVLAFLSIYLSQEMGWGERFAGFAIATYGAGACFGSYLGGYLSSIYGALRVQQGSLVATAVGYCFLSQMASRPSVLVCLFLVSVAAEALRPANVTAISESVPTHLHRRAFALNRLAVNLGFTFGPAIGGVLAGLSYTLLFLADAASCLAAAVVLTYTQARFNPDGKRTGCSANTSDDSISVTPLANTGQFACFAIVSFVLFLVFFQLLSTYPIYLRNECHLIEWQIGLLFSINTLVIVAFEMLLVDSLKRFRDVRMVAIGALLICEGFAMMSLGTSYGFVILTVLVWTIGEMIAMPTMMAFVSSSSPLEQRPKRIGTYSTIIALGFVAAPLMGSWCYQWHPNLIWWVAGVLGPIVCGGYLAIDAKQRVSLRGS